MKIADQLVHTTVQIETVTATGIRGSGTGFFMSLCEDGKVRVPVIVTNKHVIKGANSGVFRVTLSNASGDGPDLGKHVPVPVGNFEAAWILHPNADVDLAVYPVNPVLEWLGQQGHIPFFKTFNMSMVAEPEYLIKLGAAEDILMVGYPTGLWDTVHNLPIVRRGITATPPSVDFDGRPQFVIDCACFPGSSGSPVMLFNQGGYFEDGGFMVGASRVKLLGILWGGPQHTTQGEIRTIPVPTAVQPVALSRIPINLGYCVKAHELRWFEDHLAKIVQAEQVAANSNNNDKSAEGAA